MFAAVLRYTLGRVAAVLRDLGRTLCNVLLVKRRQLYSVILRNIVQRRCMIVLERCSGAYQWNVMQLCCIVERCGAVCWVVLVERIAAVPGSIAGMSCRCATHRSCAGEYRGHVMPLRNASQLCQEVSWACRRCAPEELRCRDVQLRCDARG